MKVEKLKYGAVYYCNRLKLYSFLTSKGFEPKFISHNIRNPKHLVWAFDNSSRLEEAIEEYYQLIEN